MKFLIKKALRRFGYRLAPIREEECVSNPSFDMHDLETALAVIKQNVQSDGSLMTWDRSRNYLDTRRVNFYYAVLDLIETTGALADGAHVLDVGVYFGYLLRIIHRHHPTANYHGTETNATRLAIAKTLCPSADIYHATIDNIDDSIMYDLVMLTEVLEHLVQPEQSLHRLANIADTLLLTVPDGRIDTTQAMQFNEQWGSFRGHINFWSPESWQLWLERELPERRIRTGRLPTSKLYALVQRP